MASNLGDDLKKIFLAGLGALAVTNEKSKQIVDELVKKGELTLEQGKTLNEELKHNIKGKVKEHVTVNVTKKAPADVESVKEAIGGMSSEDIESIKTKISEVESARNKSDGDNAE